MTKFEKFNIIRQKGTDNKFVILDIFVKANLQECYTLKRLEDDSEATFSMLVSIINKQCELSEETVFDKQLKELIND